MYKNKKIVSYLLSSLSIPFFLFPFLIFAQTVPVAPPTVVPIGPPNITNVTIVNPFNCEGCTLVTFIEKILNDIVLPIGGVISVLMIVYAGFLFVTARGNEAKITSAKQALLWACIGAAILIGATVISRAIGGTIDQLRT